MFAFKDSFFFVEEGDESITTVSIHQRAKKSWKSPAIMKHDLLKHNMRLMLCLRWVIRVQQRVKELNDRRILTELAHCSVTEFDRLIVCFAAVMSFTVCA